MFAVRGAADAVEQKHSRTRSESKSPRGTHALWTAVVRTLPAVVPGQLAWRTVWPPPPGLGLGLVTGRTQ